MTTRELIEAVRDAEAFMGAPSVNGVRTPCACIRATDYDALRAATLAVLDEWDAAANVHARGSIAINADAIRAASANARALRERLKP